MRKLCLSGNENKKGSNETCSAADMASMVQESGGIGVLLWPRGKHISSKGCDFSKISIPVAAIYDDGEANRLRNPSQEELVRDDFFVTVTGPNGNRKTSFALYQPENPLIDTSNFVIAAIAIFTIAIGSLWSGYIAHYVKTTQDPSERTQETITSVGNIICRVCWMCVVLLMLYFFYKYVANVMIGMFYLASVMAIWECLDPVVKWAYEVACLKWIPITKLPTNIRMSTNPNNCYLCIYKGTLELRQTLLCAISIAISSVWLVFRKDDWVWMLQDMLGILLCIDWLKSLRMPSLKICTLFLSLVFVYDIFFVFITPLFTKDGKSVMFKAVSGGVSSSKGDTDQNTCRLVKAVAGDLLPMLFKVPHLSSNQELKSCHQGFGYTILGFGDILLPGHLLSYCHSFDLRMETPYKLYWALSNVSYMFGLIATFISLYLMNTGQPALMYLVPFTLIPVITVALIRDEFNLMWQGDNTEQGVLPSEDRSNARANTEENADGDSQADKCLISWYGTNEGQHAADECLRKRRRTTENVESIPHNSEIISSSSEPH